MSLLELLWERDCPGVMRFAWRSRLAATVTGLTVGRGVGVTAGGGGASPRYCHMRLMTLEAQRGYLVVPT
jgi:hypothetical protein